MGSHLGGAPKRLAVLRVLCRILYVTSHAWCTCIVSSWLHVDGSHKCIFTFHAVTSETGRGRYITLGRTPLGSARLILRLDLEMLTGGLDAGDKWNPLVFFSCIITGTFIVRNERECVPPGENWSFFPDYGNGLLGNANIFSAKYISISVRV